VTVTPRQERSEIRAAQYNRQAFAPLYQRYADIVYGYCLRRLSDPELAADTTAEVFTKALATISSFRGDSFRSWLFTIARNAVIDRYRSRRPTEPLPASLVTLQPGPEDLALQRETQMELRAALVHLTDQQQDIITLRLAGLTGKEIAATMDMSLGAVKATQVRAFTRLRELMSAPHQSMKEGDRV